MLCSEPHQHLHTILFQDYNALPWKNSLLKYMYMLLQTKKHLAFGLNDVDIWLAEIVDSFYVFFNMFSKYDEKLVIHT